MNCDGVRGLLSAYVDGELSAGELLRVEQHLRRCHWCADEVDALRQAIALVASLEEVEVPAAFHIGLHQRLVALGPPLQAAGAASARRSKPQDFRRWAVPAAAAAALVIGVTGLKSFTPPASPGAPVSYQVPGSTATTGTDPAKNPGGGEVAKGPDTSGDDPVQSGPEPNPTPPPTNGNDEPIGDTTPPETVSPPPADDPGQQAPIGTTDPNSKVYTVASFLDDVSEPSSLPSRKQWLASLEAAVVEPSTLAAALKAHFGAASVNESNDPASGIIKLHITVGAKNFDSDLAFIEAQTGAEATTSAFEKADQIEATYGRIAQLDVRREQVEDSLTGVTDPQIIEQGKATLADLQKQAAEETAAYNTLLDQVANGTIEVTLKPTTTR